MVIIFRFQISGSKAPTLKRLGQWLQENPMYDVDPKWADLVKDRAALPPPAHDIKRLSTSSTSNTMKNKSRSSNPSPSPSIPTTSQSIPTSLASSLPFPSLGALPPSLLSGLSGLGNYDPKNNPLLLPFGGMPNLGALSGLGNMNLSNNLFANLAGLGLPSLGGMDPQALADATQANSQAGQASKSKNRKTSDMSNKNIPTSTANSMASQLPFFFPNPSLLYTPLGLGGLNPFPLPPGSMPSAYESLFNGGLPTTSTSSSSSSRHKSSTSTSRSSTVTTPATSRSSHPGHSQFSDSHLLESLTRASRGLPDMSSSRGASRSKADVESLRNLMSAIPPFAGMGADLTGLSSSKKSREQEMKDALDQFKSSAELFARIPQYSDEKGKPLTAADLVERHLKRPAMELPPLDKPSKRIKDMSPISIPIPPVPHVNKMPPVSQPIEERLAPPPPSPTPQHTLNKEDNNKTARRSSTPQPSPTESASNNTLSNSNELLPSLELTKKPPEPPPDEPEPPPVLPPVLEAPSPRPPPSSPTPPPPVLTQEDTHSTEEAIAQNTPSDSKQCADDKEDSGGNKKARKPRSKKSTLPPIIDETVVERKNLRSSAGRAAAAAAARQARAALQGEDSDNAK